MAALLNCTMLNPACQQHSYAASNSIGWMLPIPRTQVLRHASPTKSLAIKHMITDVRLHCQLRYGLCVRPGVRRSARMRRCRATGCASCVTMSCKEEPHSLFQIIIGSLSRPREVDFGIVRAGVRSQTQGGDSHALFLTPICSAMSAYDPRHCKQRRQDITSSKPCAVE